MRSTDSAGLFDSDTVAINVTAPVPPAPVNHATVFNGNTKGIGAEDSPTPVTGALSAFDADGLPGNRFNLVGLPAHGTASIHPATGAWTYIPSADYNAQALSATMV